jgi:hypothetical protein
MFRPRLGHPQAHEQFKKKILSLKKFCYNSMMTVSILGIGGIHQVSHEFLSLIMILWNDLQDLQISHTWNLSAGGLLRQAPRPSVANTVRAQGMNYRGLCKNCRCILSSRKCDKRLSSTLISGTHVPHMSPD